jgi:hypothetical protein
LDLASALLREAFLVPEESHLESHHCRLLEAFHLTSGHSGQSREVMDKRPKRRGHTSEGNHLLLFLRELDHQRGGVNFFELAGPVSPAAHLTPQIVPEGIVGRGRGGRRRGRGQQLACRGGRGRRRRGRSRALQARDIF